MDNTSDNIEYNESFDSGDYDMNVNIINKRLILPDCMDYDSDTLSYDSDNDSVNSINSNNSDKLTDTESSPIRGMVRHKSIDLLQTKYHGIISTPADLVEDNINIDDTELDIECNIPICPKHGFVRNRLLDDLNDEGSCSANSTNSATSNTSMSSVNSDNVDDDIRKRRTLSRSKSKTSITLNRSNNSNAVCIMEKYKKQRSICDISSKIKN